jgi:Icc-related predicted phosphoesterase
MLDNDYMVVGACGWHDSFSINNTYNMNDFSVISELKKDPISSIKWNRESKQFFIDTLNEFSEYKKIICVTHNSPLFDHTPYKYVGSPLNNFFVNNWSEIIKKYSPRIWISGHLHQYKKFNKFDTLFIENSYGYYNYDLNYKFDNKLMIELT